MRELRVIPTGPDTVLEALRHALSGDGPAIFPRTVVPDGIPREIEQRVALVIETSGSTGDPKRVMLSTDALLASAAASTAALGGAGQWLLALPAQYVAGINVLVRSLAAEAEPVIVPAGSFDPERFADAAGRMTEPLRYTALVPAQLDRILGSERGQEAARRFDRILLGGQAMPAQLMERAAGAGIRVTRTYGATETSGGCVYDGVPIGNTEVRVSGERIELAGNVLAEGYLDDPRATRHRFRSSDGKRWFMTDDAGTLSDGVLRVTGRLDDVIISGAMKVSLGAVEAVVRSIAGLEAACVVGVADPRWGQVPVVLSMREHPLAELRDAVSEALGPAAAPARIVVLDVLPTLDSGKPDRVALGKLALQ